MPNFDYEFNQNDYDLIATQNSETLGDFDYVRIIVRPIFDLTTIAENENEEKAVFYAALGNPQNINITPIQDSFQNISINTINTRFVGGQSNNSKGHNDFIIYKKDNNEVFIKPNEIFNDFDLPEDESTLVAGFFTEYSSASFVLFFLAEYASMILMSAMTVILFLGGWLPLFDIYPLNIIPGVIWFTVKIMFVLFL